MMSWCPPELRANYRLLTQSKGFRAAEARQIIEDHHAISMERWRRSIGIVPAVVDEVHAAGPPTIDPNLPAVDRAIAIASWKLGTTPDAVRSKVRTKPEVRTRWAVMVRLREHGISLPRIARLVGVGDHSSVIYGMREAAALAERDPVFAEALELARAA